MECLQRMLVWKNLKKSEKSFQFSVVVFSETAN